MTDEGTLRINLDQVKVASNQSEFRWVPRATSGDYQEVGDGPIIQHICRRMANDGATGKVVVYRGDTLCFHPTDINVWAEGKAIGTAGKQPEHLKKRKKSDN